jgi:hypothetical protein
MTRKLLIPLFAISMAAFGCGSDSSPSETKTDAATDVVTPSGDGGKTTTDGGLDATTVDTAPVTTDAGKDTSVSNDTAPPTTDGGADAGSDASSDATQG